MNIILWLNCAFEYIFFFINDYNDNVFEYFLFILVKKKIILTFILAHDIRHITFSDCNIMMYRIEREL